MDHRQLVAGTQPQWEMTPSGGQDARAELLAMRQMLEREWGAERVEAISVLIMRSRGAADQTSPTGRAKLVLIADWLDETEDIPTERLQEYYRKARQQKTNGFAVVATDMRAAWNLDAPIRSDEELIARQERGEWQLGL